MTAIASAKKRRRFASGTRKTLALGGIAAAGLAVSGCSDDVPAEYQFSSVQQCTTAGFDQAVCEEEFKQAQALHTENAPKFDNEAACEEQWGENQCRPAYYQSQRSSYFSPFLTGYLVSSALRDVRGYNGYYDYRARNPGYAPTTLYKGRTGGDVTISPRSKTVTPVNVNTRTAARGGFGGRSSGRSSFGG
ncbi:MAG: DUF1190 domain-containing protein [Erythrobacter sp.]|uniref:DUF1190 domain-containing protein n=1 Tax=Erythrobacter sp. Alg231-14 TaxID=1922225 RepID=UPI000D5605D7